jgi:hypothetical protein
LLNAAGKAANLWRHSISTWHQIPIADRRRPQFFSALEAILVVSNALDLYLKTDQSEIAFADIINARNDAQYLLLSLPPAPIEIVDNPNHDQEEDISEQIYELTRLALRIYSNLVLFPMNPAGGTSTTLAFALNDALLKSETTSSWIQLSYTSKRLLLWILTLGVLQIDDSVNGMEKERAWFMDRVAATREAVGLLSWYQVKECLASFVWSEHVLTLAAWEVWAEIERRQVQSAEIAY